MRGPSNNNAPPKPTWGDGPLGPGRWVKLALVVSLCVNLLILGAVVGLALRGGPDRRVGPVRDVVLPYTRALLQEDRRAVRNSLRDAGRQGDQSRDSLHGGYQAALRLLRSEPFDAEAFDQLLRDQGQATRARQELGREILTNHLSSLSPEARAAYAARLEAEVERLGSRPKGDRPRPRE